MGIQNDNNDARCERERRVPDRAILERKSLTAQINELDRVIGRMRSSYPGMVTKEAITRSQAEDRVAAIESARQVLKGLRDKHRGPTEKSSKEGGGIGADQSYKRGGERTLFD